MIRDAIGARERFAEDFFGGWEPADVELLRHYQFRAQGIAGKVTDFLGIRTSIELVPTAHHLAGLVLGELPIPTDGIRAEAIEYVALLEALAAAPGRSITLVELGAAYGPWSCTAAVLAKRANLAARIVAVEASAFMFSLIAHHFEENGVSSDAPGIRLINGAVVRSKWQRCYFPKVTSAGDNGRQVVMRIGTTDYAGRKPEYERVRPYVLREILPEGMTDLLHVDIQGTEASVLPANADLLNSRVRAVFVGTHSRKIEGELLEFFHRNGWVLRRERPAKFSYMGALSDIVGWTDRDGGQYWRNPRC